MLIYCSMWFTFLVLFWLTALSFSFLSRHHQLDMADYCPLEPGFASCFFLLKRVLPSHCHKLLAYREFFEFWCFLPSTVRSYVSKPEFNWKKYNFSFFLIKKKNYTLVSFGGQRSFRHLSNTVLCHSKHPHSSLPVPENITEDKDISREAAMEMCMFLICWSAEIPILLMLWLDMKEQFICRNEE